LSRVEEEVSQELKEQTRRAREGFLTESEEEKESLLRKAAPNQRERPRRRLKTTSRLAISRERKERTSTTVELKLASNSNRKKIKKTKRFVRGGKEGKTLEGKKTRPQTAEKRAFSQGESFNLEKRIRKSGLEVTKIEE